MYILFYQQAVQASEGLYQAVQYVEPEAVPSWTGRWRLADRCMTGAACVTCLGCCQSILLQNTYSSALLHLLYGRSTRVIPHNQCESEMTPPPLPPRPIHTPSKHRVLVVQPGRWHGGDEEL